MVKKYSVSIIGEKLLKQNKKFLDNHFNSVIEKHNVQCLICDYIWKPTIASLLSNNIKCPFCSNKKKYTIEEVNEICLKKNLLFLNSSYKNNSTKYNFKCTKCNYIWNCTFRNILLCSCPGCTNRKLTIEKIQKICLERNIIFLNQKVLTKNHKYNFKCESCNYIWEASLKNVLGFNQSGCPNCKLGKGEREVKKIFETITNEKFIKIKPDWLINPETGKRLELDGYCANLKLAFEYQGEQHYREVKGFKIGKTELKQQQKRDQVKRALCEKYGVRLIEVPQIGLFFGYKDLKNYILFQLFFTKL